MRLLLKSFIALMFLAIPANAASFSANKNNVDQTGFTLNNYSLVTFSTVNYDTSSAFASNGWTPVPIGGTAQTVVFSGQVWIYMNGTGTPPNYVVRIMKNGYPTGTTIGTSIAAPTSVANTWVMNLSAQDIAQAGDVYSVWLYATNTNAVVNGHPLHTFFSGTTVN